MFRLPIILLAGLCICGCASPRAPDSTNDSYEAANRRVFGFNQQIDEMALRPTAERYRKYVPEPVREAIHNALENLDGPVIFVNDVLQGEPRRAGETAARFLLNSSFGAAGLFDVGTRVGIPAHREDFGQTLATWGVGQGPYIVLPLLGPNSPRDTVGQVADVAMDPTIYIHIKHHMYWIMGRQYVKIVDARARNLETLDDIERDSLDFYATARSLYRQYRENEIRNGTPPSEP